MLEILDKQKLEEYLKLEIKEEENNYVVIENPFLYPRI